MLLVNMVSSIYMTLSYKTYYLHFLFLNTILYNVFTGSFKIPFLFGFWNLTSIKIQIKQLEA